MRRRREALELAERISDAYGLVLALVLVTFVVMMTLPPEGWGGRVAAVAASALTAVIAFTSSDVRPARVRLAIVVAIRFGSDGADRSSHPVGTIAQPRILSEPRSCSPSRP